jgi:SpoVK/Ycf46/Vps4 family AAA+-type ATPase
MRDPDDQALAALLGSRFPVIVVETPEEARVLQLAERVANLTGTALYAWSATSGVRRVNGREAIAGTAALPDALRHILTTPAAGLYALLDPHPFLEDPVCQRFVREIAQGHGQCARTLVLVGSRLALPPEIQRMSASFALALPTAADIRKVFKEEIELWVAQHDGRKPGGDPEAAETLVQHLVGMYKDDARRLLRQALQSDGRVTWDDVAVALKQKHHALESGGALGLQTEIEKFSAVGGQARLKRWLDRRREAFVGDAASLGLDVPRGILLLGVQGGGKSLAAKAIAGSWGLPLLRLDFGALYNKYHGETERNLRSSLDTAGAMAPCILWMDEIEKGLASGGEGDGGVSKRVLATLLTWMSERRGRVFMVATANDLSALAPELLRKGRFDEIFFVDLPADEVRRQIFAIHLAKRRRDPGRFDLAALSAASPGFSGAEIEQSIVASLYEAHALKQELTTELVLEELRATKPLSVVRAEEVAALREWALERTVLAD